MGVLRVTVMGAQTHAPNVVAYKRNPGPTTPDVVAYKRRPGPATPHVVAYKVGDFGSFAFIGVHSRLRI
jgi:hypothetical protein